MCTKGGRRCLSSVCDRLPAAAVRDYRPSRGYLPLHPVPAPLPRLRGLAALREKHWAPEALSTWDGLDGGFPLEAAQLEAVQAQRVRRRQEIVDLCVAETRRERAEAADEHQWLQWALAESEQAAAPVPHPAPRPAPRIEFRTAEGALQRIAAADAAAIARAYGRLIGRRGTAAWFFALQNEAVLAHGAHMTSCDTPVEAIGAKSWSGYLEHAGGDEQHARQDAADDVAAVFGSVAAVRYATRAAADLAAALAEAAERVAARWQVNTAQVWNALPPSVPGNHQVVLDGLLRPRHALGEEPFSFFDHTAPFSREHGGVYGAEAGAADELIDLLSSLYRRGDQKLLAVADEIADQARMARMLPTGTAERTERQWRLAELVDAAERLVDDPDVVEQVEFLPLPDPDQLPLFDTAPLFDAAGLFDTPPLFEITAAEPVFDSARAA